MAPLARPPQLVVALASLVIRSNGRGGHTAPLPFCLGVALPVEHSWWAGEPAYSASSAFSIAASPEIISQKAIIPLSLLDPVE